MALMMPSSSLRCVVLGLLLQTHHVATARPAPQLYAPPFPRAWGGDAEDTGGSTQAPVKRIRCDTPTVTAAAAVYAASTLLDTRDPPTAPTVCVVTLCGIPLLLGSGSWHGETARYTMQPPSCRLGYRYYSAPPLRSCVRRCTTYACTAAHSPSR